MGPEWLTLWFQDPATCPSPTDAAKWLVGVCKFAKGLPQGASDFRSGWFASQRKGNLPGQRKLRRNFSSFGQRQILFQLLAPDGGPGPPLQFQRHLKDLQQEL